MALVHLEHRFCVIFSRDGPSTVFLLGFQWVVPGFTGFYRVLPGFTGFLKAFCGSCTFGTSIFASFSRVMDRVPCFYWVFIGFYRVLLGFTGFYWVLLGF